MGMSTNRIKQLRIDKGLTLGQLAEKVGLSESHLSRVEAGVRGVKLSKLGALAKVLGVPMIELMPQDSFEHASDLAPYVPPKGSAVEKALATSSQRMFRVLSGVLSELEIKENDLVIADCSKDAIAQVVSGSLVVAEAINTRTDEKTLLLRQFISPHLLITNSEDQNSISIHMLKAKISILGIVIR
jgi:transcriptional regulator with XRE-family HTH domain